MSSLCRYSPPTFTVCDCSSFVSTPLKFQVFSDRSHGWLAEKPSTGSEYPLMLNCDSPLEKSSMLAPGMPTSALVVRPLATVLVTLW